ncbi:MAG: hypothetical protein J1F63_04295 [Oscillospiraceae bacterium]|nr:hypothetical protein [Oscillospiraceae bacterium]
MKKKLIPALAAMGVLFAAQSAFALGVSVNGAKLNFSASDGQPFIENGRTLVPLRATAEAYGASVGFDPTTNAAIITKDSVTVTVPIGESAVYRNGEAITNEVAAKIVDSRTYLPIRVVMESFGADVGWDAGSQTVTVNDPDVMYINGIESSSSFKSKNATNKALELIGLGDARAAAGEFHKAALLYRRSSYYWSQAPGQSETALHYLYMAEYVDSDIRLYLKTDDERYNRSLYFGEAGEPRNGILLGSTYNTGISELTGFKHGAELQYFDYGSDFSSQDSWYFRPAREKGTVLEIAWQPNQGLDMVVENDYLIEQAKYLESTGCKILLRFANEMNDSTNVWYTPDYNKYIEKYRIVANVFRKYAPSVALVWAPNFYPYNTVDLYYPGDEYVDYVGLSVYQEYNPENDPLGKGIDRGRWSSVLDRVYDTYGWKKPIIMAEGGCSYVSVWTGENITDFAVKQMEDYYTYLPIKYPNLKMAFIFNSQDWGGREFRLAQNPALLAAYIKGINSSGRYVSSPNDVATGEYYYELHHNFTVPAETIELCSFITAPLNDYDYVAYTVNGVTTAAYAIPYTASIDLSAYSGQTVEVRVQAFTGGVARADETFKLRVE